MFWRGLAGFALTRTYYEWKKSGMGYEFWKNGAGEFRPFLSEA
jgi:hypothetical protein